MTLSQFINANKETIDRHILSCSPNAKIDKAMRILFVNNDEELYFLARKNRVRFGEERRITFEKPYRGSN